MHTPLSNLIFKNTRNAFRKSEGRTHKIHSSNVPNEKGFSTKHATYFPSVSDAAA